MAAIHGVCATYIRRLEVLRHQCLRNITKIGRSDRVSNGNVRNRVLDIDLWNLSQSIKHSRLRWMRHVLRAGNVYRIVPFTVVEAMQRSTDNAAARN